VLSIFFRTLWCRHLRTAGEMTTPRSRRIRRWVVIAFGVLHAIRSDHDEICITCRHRPAFAGAGAQTNRGASDASPDGRYVLLVVEQGAHPGSVGATETQPGKGVYKIAGLRWDAGVPNLAAVRTYDPQRGHFYEPYQFSSDDRRILFASDIDVAPGFLSPSAFNAQI
jgi:hypothetical protein